MEVIMMLLMVGVGMAVVALVIAAIFYVMESIGLQTLARNRELAAPWLVWIPVAGMYKRGEIADDINIREDRKSVYRFAAVIISSLSLLSLAGLFLLFGTRDIAALDPGDMIPLVLVGALFLLFRFVDDMLKFGYLNKIYQCYSPSGAQLFHSFSVLCYLVVKVIAIVLLFFFPPLAIVVDVFSGMLTSIFPFVLRGKAPNLIHPPKEGYVVYTADHLTNPWNPGPGSQYPATAAPPQIHAAPPAYPPAVQATPFAQAPHQEPQGPPVDPPPFGPGGPMA